MQPLGWCKKHDFKDLCLFDTLDSRVYITFVAKCFWINWIYRRVQSYLCKYIYILFIFCVFFTILQFSRFPHFSCFSRFLRFPQFSQGFYRSVILGFFRFCCVQKLAFLFVIDNFCFRYTSKTQRFPTCTTQRLDIHY